MPRWRHTQHRVTADISGAMYVWAAAVAGVLFAVFIIAFTWYISGAFLRPPFLTHNPGKKLAVVGHGIHPAWGTHIHDPLVDFGLQFKDVEFRAGGDVPHTCRGWLIDRRGTPNARRVAVVFVHGGGRDRRAFLRHSSWVCREGYSALLYDSRGHGVSDGKAGLSFGLHEVGWFGLCTRKVGLSPPTSWPSHSTRTPWQPFASCARKASTAWS